MHAWYCSLTPAPHLFMHLKKRKIFLFYILLPTFAVPQNWQLNFVLIMKRKLPIKTIKDFFLRLTSFSLVKRYLHIISAIMLRTFFVRDNLAEMLKAKCCMFTLQACTLDFQFFHTSINVFKLCGKNYLIYQSCILWFSPFKMLFLSRVKKKERSNLCNS